MSEHFNQHFRIHIGEYIAYIYRPSQGIETSWLQNIAYGVHRTAWAHVHVCTLNLVCVLIIASGVLWASGVSLRIKTSFQMPLSTLKTHLLNPNLLDPQRQPRCAHTVPSISSVSLTPMPRSCIQQSLWVRHKKMSTGALKCIMAAGSLKLYLFIRYWIGIN